MACPAGFEPATCRLEGGCSIQLSYGAVGKLSSRFGRFGEAALIDCHSMPSRAGQAEIIVGDRHGSSAAAWLSQEAARLARGAGFKVALNDPYAGGAIIAQHGHPAAGIHALQLEIDRSTYLAVDGRTPGVGLDRIAAFLEALARGLGDMLLSRADTGKAARLLGYRPLYDLRSGLAQTIDWYMAHLLREQPRSLAHV